MTADFNIIYDGIGSCDDNDNAVYKVVLPILNNTNHFYRLDDVYDFTGDWSPSGNVLVLIMSVQGMDPDVDLSDFSTTGYDPQDVILHPFFFSLNKTAIKTIPTNLIPEGATYTRYDENDDDFTIVVYHDDNTEANRITNAVKDIISVDKNNKGMTRKDIPKAKGIGTLKKIRP